MSLPSSGDRPSTGSDDSFDADDDGKSELLAVEHRVAGCQWTVGDVFSCVQPVDVVRPCLFVLFDLVEVPE